MRDSGDNEQNSRKAGRKRGVPYVAYFGAMGLGQGQIEERIRFSEDAEEALLIFFLLMQAYRDYGGAAFEKPVVQFSEQYRELILKYMDDGAFASWYSVTLANEIADATKSHLDDEWYFSMDRAQFASENEANTVLGRRDFNEAVARGFTRKQWTTEKDERVRETHGRLDGMAISIHDVFPVGNAVMRFPKDVEMAGGNPEEYVNCRCSIRYLK